MIHLRHVNLEYPVRHAGAASLKEFLLGGLFRRRVSVHALRDVTLSIAPGERVGIIGANGAGKSTLLRVLAGVYPITSGVRQVPGRVVSLFEPGLGFEPEATGRHNVKLRAYLQGETPATLQRRMAEIEAFAELGDALDLPLRCYSTGMVLRLALAVALAETTDVLLIDEFFFAADALFRQRVEDRLDDAMRRAPMVVLAGHDVDYLASRCTRMIQLAGGQVVADGPPDVVLAGKRAPAIPRNLFAHPGVSRS